MEQPSSPTKVMVTPRALTQRIARALRRDGSILKKARSPRAVQNVGEFYVVDAAKNAITATHCDLEELGRELEVLAGYEALADG